MTADQRPCPACGALVHETQHGQTNDHRARTGCSYVGMGGIEDYDIHPLKFDVRPAVTAALGAANEQQAVTVRYDLEQCIKPRDHLSLRDTEGVPFGIGEVETVKKTQVCLIWNRIEESDALYSINEYQDLLDTLNHYYEETIEDSTHAEAIFYEPKWVGFK